MLKQDNPSANQRAKIHLFRQRLHWVDYLKATGIVLVVIGHSKIPQLAIQYIYSFHIPLFFLISGALIKKPDPHANLGDILHKRTSSLLKLYFFFSAVGLLHFALISQSGTERLPLREAVIQRLLSIAYASGTAEQPLTLYPIVLWFFPALVSAMILYSLIERGPSKIQFTLGIAAFVCSLIFSHMALPWELESGLAAIPFLQAGNILHQYIQKSKVTGKARSILAILLISTGVALCSINGKIDFLSSSFGNPILMIGSALSTSVGLYFIASQLPQNKWVTRTATATATIFPLHTIFFWAFDHIADKLHLPGKWSHCITYELTKCAAALFLLTLAHHAWVRCNSMIRINRRCPAG